VDRARVTVDQTADLLLRLPETSDFSGMDLGKDRSTELKQVEQEHR
jgi:alpha-acetolactate decarboxylase